MYRLILVITFWAFCLTPQWAVAQSTAGTDRLHIPTAAQRVIDAFGKPLHPIVGGVAPGGGIGVGIGYDTPRGRNWFHDASARVTLHRYWAVDGETGYQTHTSRIGVFGEARHMNRIDFFGIGPNSQLATHTNFRLRENAFGVRGWFQPRADIRLGGTLQAYSPDLGSGASQDLLSIEELFHPGEVPGLTASPLFTRARGFVEFTYPTLAAPAQPGGAYESYQGKYQIALEEVRDHDDGLYNFHRFEAEGQQRFPGVKPGQRLTLHGLVAVTNANAVAPYYLQYTLGGGGALSAFRPNTIGTDGTKATLRSFQNYRFRDRDLLLMQAEYRIPLHKAIHATVFYDAGQVADRTSGLFKDLRQGTGFSLGVMRSGEALVRLDVGYGSGEGMHLFWGFEGLGL